MGPAKLRMEEKGAILALFREGLSKREVARRTRRSAKCVRNVIKATIAHGGVIQKRKQGSGRKRKTGQRTDMLLRREVLKNPFITAKELKGMHRDVLGDVAVRTLQQRLQKDFKLPCRRAAHKPGIAALDPSTEEHGVLVETQPSQLKIEPMEEDTAGFSKNAPAVCGSHPVTTFNAKEAASQTSVCTSQPHMSGLTLSEALRFHKEKLQIDLANKANGAINLTVQAAPHIWEEGMQKQHASGSGNSIFNSTRKYAEANSGTKIEFEVDVDDKTVTSYPLHVIHNNPEYQPRLTSAVIEKGSLPSLKLHTNSQKASVVMILNYLEGATEASVTQENEVPSNTFSVTEDIVKEEIIDESELQGNEIFSNAFLVPEDIVKEETLDESVTHQNEVFK